MIRLEELIMAAKIVSEKLGEDSEYKHLGNSIQNMEKEKLIDHIRSEVITLDGLEGFALFENSKKTNNFVKNMEIIDSSICNLTGQDPRLIDKTSEALEEAEGNWFKIGLKLGMEIEKRKSRLARIKDLNLSEEDLRIVREEAKFMG